MKLAIIYDERCPKLTEEAYSWTYLDMFRAVIDRFDEVQHINTSCSAKDIEADVILIYDLHSSHHITIAGMKNHKAVKYTYFNDPHQKYMEGVYNRTGLYVHKFGPKSRVRRALRRGIDYIICPYTGQYNRFIAPHLGKDAEKMLFWFPPAPSYKRFGLSLRPIKKRLHKILANGITWGGDGDYDFRLWTYTQPESFCLQHTACKTNKTNQPKGKDYPKLLADFAAIIVACDTRIVPKYLEAPLAGCLCFAQDQEDYRKMGFEDGVSCILVDQKNFKEKARAFLDSDLNKNHYQSIADSGRILISNKWTAECFADALYKHAQKRIKQSNLKETKP